MDIIPLEPKNCIILIGMAACGKSAVGKALATKLSWAHVDTDHLIEASYGTQLQNIADAFSKDEFLDIESAVVQTINLTRTVISTGGSVVYREAAMQHLATLGPIILLDAPLPIILERIARKPDRGLAIAPGQTIEDLFHERHALYQKYAHHQLICGTASAQEHAELLLSRIQLPA